VTVTGIGEAVSDPALRARYLAVHPYASLYADFGDFHLWRIRPMAALFVGGFARAVRLRQADMAPDAAAVIAIVEAELGIISHCNNDHAGALAAIAGDDGDWRMVTADVDGMDLAAGERVMRVHWSSPVTSASGVRTELVRMAREAWARER
jgi:putative heme iron utilization protein